MAQAKRKILTQDQKDKRNKAARAKYVSKRKTPVKFHRTKPIQKDNYTACVRGVHEHRGYPIQTAHQICDKTVGDPKKKNKKK